MNILKPETLDVTTQPLDWGGKLYQSLTISFGFDLLTGAPLPIEKALSAAMKSLASGDCLDMGLPKKQPEWLLAGKACTPHGALMRGLVVQTAVGESRREWLIRSEREEPFAEMPLIWANTWGSPQHPDNPLGCGLEKDASGRLRLPTVLDKVDGNRQPVSPGPLGAWPCRMKNMGTYDAAWLQNHWPGVPKDFDWAFYNVAQPQQRLSQLVGGEKILLTNLHPEHPRIEVTAPDNQLRLEIRRSVSASEASEVLGEWKSCAAARDTIWLFPGELVGLYLWHCLVSCVDTTASDIADIRVTLEPEAVLAPELPLPPPVVPENSAKVVPSAAATSAVLGAADATAGSAAVVDVLASAETNSVHANSASSGEVLTSAAPSSPVGPESAPPIASVIVRDALQQLKENKEEINQALLEQGLPPLSPEQEAEIERYLHETGVHIAQALDQPEPPEDPFTVLVQAGLSESDATAACKALDMEQPNPSDFASQAEWEAAAEAHIQSFAQVMNPSESTLEMMRTVLKMQGPNSIEAFDALNGKPHPEGAEALIEAGIDPEVAVQVLNHLENDVIPGTDDMDGLVAYAKKLETSCALPAGSVSGFIETMRNAMIEIGLLEKPLPGKASALTEHPDVRVEPQTTEQPAQQNMEGAAAQVAGASPETPTATKSDGGSPSREAVVAALLAGLPLVGAVCVGLDLTGLDFSDRDLRKANFEGAKLDGANFSRSDVTGGRFTGVSLSDALFHETKLSGVSFDAAVAPDADFTGAVLTEASFVGATLTGATFAKAEASGLKAAGAQCDKMRIQFCTLDNADFEGAKLQHVDFHETSLANTSFVKADLTDASLGCGTHAPGVICTGATLTGSTWKAVSCVGGRFTGALADKASFTDCDLSGSTWRSARARGGDFSRAILLKADARHSDMYGASFREARAETADFSAASLYSADLYRFGYGPQTGLDGTDLTATIIAARAKL